MGRLDPPHSPPDRRMTMIRALIEDVVELVGIASFITTIILWSM